MTTYLGHIGKGKLGTANSRAMPARKEAGFRQGVPHTGNFPSKCKAGPNLATNLLYSIAAIRAEDSARIKRCKIEQLFFS